MTRKSAWTVAAVFLIPTQQWLYAGKDGVECFDYGDDRVVAYGPDNVPLYNMPLQHCVINYSGAIKDENENTG